jgi:hypothetical protein
MTPPPFGGVTVDNTLYMGVFGDECDKYSAVSPLSDTPKNLSRSPSPAKSLAKDEVNQQLFPNVTMTQVKYFFPTKTSLTLKKANYDRVKEKFQKMMKNFDLSTKKIKTLSDEKQELQIEVIALRKRTKSLKLTIGNHETELIESAQETETTLVMY